MASQSISSSSLSVRIQDFDEKKEPNFTPITGVVKAPTLSLSDAIDYSKYDWDGKSSSIKVALMKAEYVFKKNSSHPLTKDQIAAINLYTQGNDFYRTLNKLLRDSDRDKLKPYFPYLKLVSFGLAKLPRSSLHLYRGIKVDVLSEYSKGDERLWWSITSCTDTMEACENFIGGHNDNRTLFCIDAKYAVDISEFSSYPDEKEWILFPGVQLDIKSKLPSMKLIQLKEINKPFLLQDIDDYTSINNNSSNNNNNNSISVIDDVKSNKSESKNSSSSNPIQPTPLIDVLSKYNNNNNNPLKELYRIGGINRGEKNGELNDPGQLCIDDKNKRLLIADKWNNRIQIFDNYGIDGKHAFNIGTGKAGDGDDKLNHPIGVAVYNNEIFISDTWNHRIMVFKASNGSFIRKWGRFGKGKEALFLPRHLCVDGDTQELYVHDFYNGRIQIYSLSGEHHRSIPLINFKWPSGISLWGNYCYVTDTKGNSFSVYNKINGELIKKITTDEKVMGLTINDGILFILGKKIIYLYDVTASFIRSFSVHNISDREYWTDMCIYRCEFSAFYLSIYPFSVHIYQL